MFSGSTESLRAFVLAIGLLSSGCAVPVVTLFGDNDAGASLEAGESSALHFFTSDGNFNTGVRLNVGNTYAIKLAILSHWIDSDIELNENGDELNETGFANSLMPVEALGLTRRSRNHRWFELMLYQPNCGRDSLRGITELSSDETTGEYRFVAACDGNLRLFVNDSPGFYFNNLGYANITLSRIN